MTPDQADDVIRLLNHILIVNAFSAVLIMLHNIFRR